MQNNIPQKIASIKYLWENDSKISPIAFILSALFTSLFFYVSALFDIMFVAVLVVLALFLIWLMLHYPRVWIYCIVVGFVLFFGRKLGETTTKDIIVAGFYNSFLIIWFVYQLIIKPLSLKYHHSKNNVAIKYNEIPTIEFNIIDKFIFLFYLFLLFNFILAVFNDVDLFAWFKEYLLYSLILYYIPIREYFKEEKPLIFLVAILGLTSIALSVQQIILYSTRMDYIMQAYQGIASWAVNQQISSAGVIVGIVLFFYAKTKKGKLLSMLATILSAVAIISTFSRAFWASIIFMLVVLILFLNYRQIFQLFAMIAISVSIVILSLDTFLPATYSNLFKQQVVKRFLSTSKGQKDGSVLMRFEEYNAVYKMIAQAPITGHGLQKIFSYYSPAYAKISNSLIGNVTTSFVHNGYLKLSYTIGIPMTALFYLSIFVYLFKGIIVAWKFGKYLPQRKFKNLNIYKFAELYRGLAIGAILTLGMLFITNMATSSFFFKDGVMVTAFCLAFIGIADNKCKNLQKSFVNL